jgi:sortase (surface protein transpeptidase)
MRRVLGSGWLLPAVLAAAGAVLIVVGQMQPGTADPGPTLAPISRPTPTEEATPRPTPTSEPEPTETATETETATPSPVATPTPLPDDVVAVQLEVPALGINVLVFQSTGGGIDEFPPADAAYVLQGSAQPGHHENSYVFAHALTYLFKPLWNAQLGHQVLVAMSDGSVLEYVVTEIHPNVSCPDPAAVGDNPPNPPLDLIYAGPTCDEGVRWTIPIGYERLTLQTSQGFNRNWGELVIIAEPVS